MTKEEAWRRTKGYLYDALSGEEADEIIKALEQEPTTKNDLGVDAISREDALMCLTGKFEIRKYEPSELVSIFSKRIKTLPPVTPQEPQSFKWCTDCKEYDQEKHCCHRWSKVIRDTVEEMKQEPRKGHWKYDRAIVRCSNCGRGYKDAFGRTSAITYNYCPNCGAKMVEPQERENKE